VGFRGALAGGKGRRFQFVLQPGGRGRVLVEAENAEDFLDERLLGRSVGAGGTGRLRAEFFRAVASILTPLAAATAISAIPATALVRALVPAAGAAAAFVAGVVFVAFLAATG